jgi:hypothetical protein
VLNEFLHGVSKGFQDAAFAAFSRRRSTVREDIAQSFAAPTEEPSGSTGGDYLAMLNAEPAPALAEAIEAPAPVNVKAAPKRSSKPKGVVDSGRGSAKPARKVRRGEDGDLRQL